MEKIDWEFVQNNSDKILSDGLYKLKMAPSFKAADIQGTTACNYLISHNEATYYTGEGENAAQRLLQQFKPATSTFYPSYQKQTQESQNLEILDIEAFSVQFIHTNLGRKELEEFAIVNLSPPLNKFQRDKRLRYEVGCKQGLWDNIQIKKDHLLKQGEDEILRSVFHRWFDNSAPSVAGIYIVKNGKGDLIYIGESSLLSKRYMAHSSRTYFSALRRHIGTEILGYKLQEIKGKKRYFTSGEDMKVTEFLKECSIALCPIAFGRYEIEEYLIKKHRPYLNRKSKPKL